MADRATKPKSTRTPARPTDPRDHLRRTEARLREAAARARACAQAERRMREELAVYKEEKTLQTRQLVSANEALEGSHERYVGLYDYAPVAFVSLDHTGVIDDLNLAAADMLGADRVRLLKLPLLSFVEAASRRAFLNHMLRCRRNEVPVKTELTVHSRRGGAVPVLLATWFGVPHDAPRTGPGWEFRSALLDLTDRKAAEAQEIAYQNRLSSLASELSLAEERERRRIAVEIHDNLSQNLALVKMKLAMLRHGAEPGDVLRGLDDAIALLDPLLERTRTLTFELSPPVLYELGLDAALEWLADRVGQQHGVAVRFKGQPKPAGRAAPAPVPEDVAVLLFQAVRELLMNVVKHARASHVEVRSARAGSKVTVAVADDGRGFDPASLTAAARNGDSRNRKTGGFGLFSIRTRLEHMGGRMEIRSGDGSGTEVTLTVPLAAPDNGAPRRAALRPAAPPRSPAAAGPKAKEQFVAGPGGAVGRTPSVHDGALTGPDGARGRTPHRALADDPPSRVRKRSQK